MTSNNNVQVLRENKLMENKLRQIFLDVNHAYNYVYEHKYNEALTALSVVIMEIGTVLQAVQHKEPVVDPFSFKEEYHGNIIYPPRERRSVANSSQFGRRKGDRSSPRTE